MQARVKETLKCVEGWRTSGGHVRFVYEGDRASGLGLTMRLCGQFECVDIVNVLNLVSSPDDEKRDRRGKDSRHSI